MSYGLANPYVSTNMVNGYSTTSTSGGTLTLTSASNYLQYLTGTSGHTVKLPNTTGLVLGFSYQIENYSTASITVQIGSSATTLTTVAASNAVIVTVTNATSDATTSWRVWPITPSAGGSLVGDVNGAPSTNLVQFIDSLPIITTNPLTSNASMYWGYSGTAPTGVQSVGLGYQALNVNTGSSNTAVGYQALAANTSSTGNTAVGYQALQNYTGVSGGTAVGYQALQACTSGINTALGCQALTSTTTGTQNTAIGDAAMLSNTTGSFNTVMGCGVLQLGRTSTNNVAVGNFGLHAVNGSNNTAFGFEALQGATYTTGTIAQSGTAVTGTGTTFTPDMVGGTIYNTSGGGPFSQTITNYNSATSLTVGTSNTISAGATYIVFYPVSNNTAVGMLALGSYLGSNSTAVGYNSLANSTSVGTVSASSSTTVTGTGTNFTSAMIGGYIYGTSGSASSEQARSKITAVGSTTSLTTESAVTLSSGFYSQEQNPYYITSPTGSRYTVGTLAASASSATVTGNAGVNWKTTWDVTNATIVLASGTTSRVTAITSATTLTVSPNIAVTGGSTYTLYFPNMGNTAIGYNSGSGLTTGFNNTIIGAYSGAAAPISATGDGYVVVSDMTGKPQISVAPRVSVVFGIPVTISAGTYTVLVTDSSLLCNATMTLTLLSAATYPGRMLHIRRGGAFTITSNASNVTLLAGTTGQAAIIGGAGAANWVMLQSDGTNWITMMGA